jgi:hypothetical protein
MRIATALLLAAMLLVPTVSMFPAPQQRDVPAEVESAKQALRNARNELQHAGGEWGGHRAAAVKHIDEALRELNEGERWAREHHEIR